MCRIRQISKYLLFKISPDLAARIQGYTQHAHIQKIEKGRGIPALVGRYLESHRAEVMAGPFSGMKYHTEAVGSSILPKLLGTYELEIHEAMEQALSEDYKRIIDIGCAEGYYAVGFARAKPDTRVIAFDLSPIAHRKCRALAEMNGVNSNLELDRRCTRTRLRQLADRNVLIICDCEGCEWDLLDPMEVPSLGSADLLVELHCFENAHRVTSFVERFSPTHDVLTISAKSRDGSEANSAISDWPLSDRMTALDEMRSDNQVWVWARSRDRTVVCDA